MTTSTVPPEDKSHREWMAAFRQFPRVIRLVWGAHPTAIVAVAFLAIVGGILPAVMLYAGKKVIDGVTLWIGGEATAGRPLVTWFLMLLLGVMILNEVLVQVKGFFERMLQLRLTNQIQRKIIDRAALLDFAFYESPKFYDRLQRAQREAGLRPFTTLRSAVASLSVLSTLLSYAIVLATLEWWLVPLVAAIAIPGLAVRTRYGRLGYFMIYRRTHDERVRRYLEEVLTSDRHAKEVRLFGLAEYLVGRWQDLFDGFYRKDMDLARRRMAAELAAALVQTAAGIGFYVFAIYRTITDPAVTVGSLVMYTQAMERSIGSVSGMFNIIADLYSNNLYIRDLFEFLEQRPTVVAPSSVVAVPSPIRKGVTFDRVGFTYPGTDVPVLQDVSFTIHPGERVAVVGENGAGKTTLIKLLARLYDTSEGRILVDGIDIRNVDPVEWQRQIGIVFQDYVRYHLTARENVGFGQIDVMDDIARIEAAATLSGAMDIVSRLARGWENVLGKRFEEGQELSGGEWQQIALARAFLRDAQILVLDEPTASLDANQEYKTFVKFNDLTRGKTTILISHRFSTVRMVERILVVEQGRIVESGSHAELVDLRGRYAHMFRRQAQGYR